MKRTLVTVEHDGEVVAGIYVNALDVHDATTQVAKYLAECKLIVWGKAEPKEVK